MLLSVLINITVTGIQNFNMPVKYRNVTNRKGGLKFELMWPTESSSCFVHLYSHGHTSRA